MIDVAIVGAGPAGLFLAAELRRRHLDVLLLERSPGPRPGTRAIGVHPPALAAMEPSGATDRLLVHAVRISRGIACTAGRRLAEVGFDRADARFGFVAAAAQSTTEDAVRQDAPEPIWDAHAIAIDEVDGAARVVCRTGADVREHRARAVVVAAGSSGRALTTPIARYRAHAYPDRYLMADLPYAPAPPVDAAVITLAAAGVVESFPLPGTGRRLVVWAGTGSGDAIEVERAERMRRAVAERTRDEALAALIERVTSFGVRRVLLRRMRRGRLFCIGDAAHEVSPIGGQGMNLALIDAATLAPELAAWLRRPEATGGLERWERDRLASARTAARLAGLNTAIGRARANPAHALATGAIRAAAATPLLRLAARAYAMGFDRAA